MRALFKNFSKYKALKSPIDAWCDFLPHDEKLDFWDESLTNRLNEVLLYEEPEPLTSNELNRLTDDKNCSCPMREALISWTNLNNRPDQQLICSKGDALLAFLLP